MLVQRLICEFNHIFIVVHFIHALGFQSDKHVY